MKRQKGFLLKTKPYTITEVGKGGMKIVLPKLTLLNPKGKVYIERLDDGCVLLIPEEIYESSID